VVRQAVVAPDFRGFGESDKPDLPPAKGYTPEILAEDLVALLDALGVSRVVVGAYDIGATVAQTLARDHADRVRALALFNPAYPGIGGRRFDPSVQREFWYQHFHALAWSDRLIAHDRETVRLYLEYFYDHWCGRKDSIREREFEAIVDVYARPGAVRGSIAYYRARAAQRQTQTGAPPEDSRIRQPTVIAWGELDPVILAAWADRLGETFLDHEAVAPAGDRTLRSDRGTRADDRDDPSIACVSPPARAKGRRTIVSAACRVFLHPRPGNGLATHVAANRERNRTR
jgi:pimeloyl-ACP methyl ester carboxylesterase